MQHDLARRHLDFHNSAYVVGIGSTDTELLISIIRKNGGVRTNNYLIPNAEGKVTLSQSVGTDYQKKEIVVECVGLK